MECRCENDAEAASAGWFLGGGNVQMGAFAVVGYLLYRFSQTLPALIRWPVRFFCYITGLSALWSWVSRLVGTLRGIKNLVKWLSQVCRFLVGSAGDGALVRSASEEEADLRLILLGPSGEGRALVADALLGASTAPMNQSTKWSAVIDGRAVTVVDAPDILGSSLGNADRAREALRSLQLVSPGPHAFLLVIRAPGSATAVHRDLTRPVRATLELFGEGVTGYVLPVLTRADGGRGNAAETGELDEALSLCGQRPELVDGRPDLPPRARSDLCRTVLERVMEMKGCRGHFVHELHRREDELREKLLDDMSSALTTRLGCL